MQSSPKEKRKHSRIHLEFDAELQIDNGSVYHGKTKNISFGGLYLYTSNAIDISIGATATLTLLRDSQTAQNEINFKCQVVHSHESGVGVKFISIDLNGYQEFKHIMVYNSTEGDKLQAELEKDPGLSIS